MAKKFPNYQQLLGTNDCGPCCLINILDFLGKVNEVTTIKNQLSLGQNNYSFAADHADRLHSLGLNVRLLAIHSEYCPTYTRDWQGKNNSEQLRLVRNWQNSHYGDPWMRNSHAIENYLNNGGTIRVLSKLRTTTINKYLRSGYKLIFCCDRQLLWQGSVNDHGHFIIIYGRDHDKYLVSDPYPDQVKGGYYTIEPKTLFDATLDWDPEIIAVKA